MAAITALNQQNKFPAATTVVDPVLYTAVQNLITASNANGAGAVTGSGASVLATAPTIASPVITGNTLLSGSLDTSLIQYATVALSNADILALFATPKLIVAAQGVHTLVEVVSCVIEYVKSTAFTIGSAGNITLNYKSDASGGAITVALAATGFLDGSSSQIRLVKAVTTNVDVTAVTNQGVYLTVATADVTGGSGSTGIVKVAYRVHSNFS